ncbi:MMPL family transporter [Staphylococcus auricularis]|uniref:MMPL family transporter n=1 Tax=Staphylococcus auricularis TaxID=29379 RepID=UPI00248DC8CE|nr:MMPL family transporter [Staphylococcus auricularis]
MKTILKFKWPITIALIIIIVLSLIFAPNLSQLAQEKGDIEPPSDSTSVKYNEMLDDLGANNNSIVAVVQLDSPLSKDGDKDLENYIDKVKDVDGVDDVISPFAEDEVYDKIVSDDHKNIMLPIELSKNDAVNIASSIDDIDQNFKSVDLTSNELVNSDIDESTNEGLQMTEIVTVVLIIIILLIVFRSIVTPIIPLFIVGISYLFSSALIAFMVKYLDLPVSIYIQPFLVALLFGIGTDYCILLINRFKEELSSVDDVTTATYNTFTSGGKTILLCGLTIVLAFATLFFAKFDLFQSAVGIGIGVICLLVVIYTLLPLLMTLLGHKLFWPSKQTASHKDNKIWGKLSDFTQKYSFVTILAVLLICVPIIYFIPNDTTYDNTNEISDDYSSVKGLNIIKDKFALGEAFPVNVGIKDDDKLTTSEGISDLESLSKKLENIDGVKNVNTITRPTGEPIKQLSATYQLDEIQKNLTDANEGLNEVDNGLGEMNQQVQPLTQAEMVQALMMQGMQSPEAAGQSITQQASALSQGLTQAQQGIGQVTEGQEQLQQYLDDIANDDNVNDSGVYISNDMLKDDNMKEAIDQYSEDNGKFVRIDVDLDKNPYGKDAFKTVSQIKQTVNDEAKDSAFKDSTIEFGGITSINLDLENTINDDMVKIIALMSLLTFIALVIFKRSIIMPLYMIASILLTYYVSMSLGNLIFDDILQTKGILLVTPFFSLVILFALGIDYAIFLLNRFNEEADTQPIGAALHTAMTKMGTVIVTACIIIIGTIAALYTSGALTLMQIATILIIGLLIYNILILPLFIPAIVHSFGRGNWWPFPPKSKQ